MGDWQDYVVTRDASGRLYVAHCSLCGHLIAASPDRPITQKLAESHHCDMQVRVRVKSPGAT
jgi:hypothetical protein